VGLRIRRPALAGAAIVVVIVVLTVLSPTSAKEQLQNLLGGTGSGALYAAIALGVVLTFRGSGVVNFANGATAMYIGYVYNDLRRTGKLFLPPLPNPLALIQGLVHKAGAHSFSVLDWPTSIDFNGGQPLSLWPAIGLALVFAVLLGLLFHFLVFRPLRHAPPLAKVVATVGIFLVLQAVVVLRFTSQAQPVRFILKKQPVKFPGGITIGRDQLILAALVLAIAVLLWGVFRFSRFGLATRAAAENEKGAVLLGFSPEFLAGTNWVLSTLLAGLLGILLASVNGSLDPTTFSLLIVPALGAALLGGFSSFGITTAAAFAIAWSQAWLRFIETKHWFPQTSQGPFPGVVEALPFIVIVVALFLRGRALPERGTISSGRLPFAPRPNHLVARTVLPAGACVLALFTLSSDWRLAITNSLVGMVICLSLVVLTGFVGQISLAQMTLAGVAGFTLSKLVTSAGVPFPFGPLIGAMIAAAFGLLTAIPALRVRGVNLAVVTLAAAVAIENFVFRNPSWSGGLNGANVGPPRFAGLKFGPNDVSKVGDGKLPDPFFGVFCLIVVVLLALMIVNVRRSTTGRQLLAVRSNERAAAAAGVSVAGTKLLAFGLAAFVAGIGGALSGYRFGSVTPNTFGSIASLTFLAFAYLGGISSVTGAVLGGFIVAGGISFTALQHWFHVDPRYTLLLGGLGLIITAILNPEGIAGALRETGLALRRLIPARPTGTPIEVHETRALARAGDTA
jgi:branched-chain amino acid transport system permease protein